MFGLGMGEIILIAVVALLVLGPDRLPGAAKSLGKTIRDLKKQTRELQHSIEADSELGDAMREIKSAFRDEVPPKTPQTEDSLVRPHPDAVPRVGDDPAVTDGEVTDAAAATGTATGGAAAAASANAAVVASANAAVVASATAAVAASANAAVAASANAAAPDDGGANPDTATPTLKSDD